MRSRSMFPKNLSTSGKPFINERTNTSFKGILVLTQGKPRIDFENSVDVKSTDWLVNSVGERLYVTELVSLSDSYKSCYYINEHDYNQSKQSNTAFSINDNLSRCIGDKREVCIFGATSLLICQIKTI